MKLSSGNTKIIYEIQRNKQCYEQPHGVGCLLISLGLLDALAFS